MAKRKQKDPFEDMITSAIKAYSHCAKIEIDGEYAVIRNTYNPATLHIFVDGREKILLNKAQKNIVAGLIKKYYKL